MHICGSSVPSYKAQKSNYMDLFGKICHNKNGADIEGIKSMTTMNISLPETMKDFVDNQVQDGGYSTSSEYVRDLTRKEQVRLGDQHLATLLVEGLQSGSAIVADDAYWKNKRAALANRHEGE